MIGYFFTMFAVLTGILTVFLILYAAGRAAADWVLDVTDSIFLGALTLLLFICVLPISTIYAIASTYGG